MIISVLLGYKIEIFGKNFNLNIGRVLALGAVCAGSFARIGEECTAVMPDNLRITTPINAENVGKLKTPERAPVNAPVVDPTKVFSKSENAKDAGRQAGLLDSNSVFGGFMTALSKSPMLSESLGKMIFGALAGMNDEIQTGNPANPVLSALADAVVMNKQDMLVNLLYQQKHLTVFSAEIFKLFQQLSQNPSSPAFSQYLGNFLKAYDGYRSSASVMAGAEKQLRGILRYIPKSYREPIEQVMTGLKLPTNAQKTVYSSGYADGGDFDTDLALFKEKILPLLARYVSTFNDFGEVRDKISLLVHDIAILNVGSRTQVGESFQALLEYCRYEMNLSSADVSRLRQSFAELLNNLPLENSNKLAEALSGALLAGQNSGVYAAGSITLMDAMNALLMDYSVYMPFFHLFLPALYRGRFLFADIWMEKKKSAWDEQSPPGQTLYIRFDIHDFGVFQGELTINYKEVMCQLYLPQMLAGQTAAVEQDIRGIFAANGLLARVTCTAGEMDIYEKIKQRVGQERDGVNVTV